jgi:hypothetical protein
MALVNPGADARDVTPAEDDVPESEVMTYSSTVVIVSVLVGIVALIMALWFAA